MSSRSVQAPGGLRQTFVRVGPATVLAQVMSFGSSIALATLLGPSTQTDAYYLALSVPALAYGVLIAAARLGGIPALTEIAHNRSAQRFERACREVVSATLVASVLLSVAITAVMSAVLPAVAGGSARLHELTREFMLELSPYAVTGALIGVLGAILAVRGRFAISMLVLVFEPALKTVLLILFHRQLGAQALVIGSVVGNLAAAVLLWAILWRDGVPLHFERFRQSPVVRNVLKISVPLLVGQSVIQFNPVIDRTFAAPLGAGSVTEFELGVRLFTAPASLLAATLAAPLAATWAARLERGGWEAVTASLQRVMIAVTLLVPPLVAVGIVLRRQAIGLAYASHAYSNAAIGRTASVFAMLLLGLLPQLLIPTLATLFIIRRETIFPMKVGIANCVLNAVLDWALRGPLGVGGIALSTSLTLAILCAVYAWAANRRWGLGAAGRAVWGPAALFLSSAGAIGVASYLVLTATGPYGSRWLELLAITSIGGVALLCYWAVVTVGAAFGTGGNSLQLPGVARARMLLGRAAGAQPPLTSAGPGADRG